MIAAEVGGEKDPWFLSTFICLEWSNYLLGPTGSFFSRNVRFVPSACSQATNLRHGNLIPFLVRSASSSTAVQLLNTHFTVNQRVLEMLKLCSVPVGRSAAQPVRPVLSLGSPKHCACSYNLRSKHSTVRKFFLQMSCRMFAVWLGGCQQCAGCFLKSISKSIHLQQLVLNCGFVFVLNECILVLILSPRLSSSYSFSYLG